MPWLCCHHRNVVKIVILLSCICPCNTSRHCCTKRWKNIVQKVEETASSEHLSQVSLLGLTFRTGWPLYFLLSCIELCHHGKFDVVKKETIAPWLIKWIFAFVILVPFHRCDRLFFSKRQILIVLGGRLSSFLFKQIKLFIYLADVNMFPLSLYTCQF